MTRARDRLKQPCPLCGRTQRDWLLELDSGHAWGVCRRCQLIERLAEAGAHPPLPAAAGDSETLHGRACFRQALLERHVPLSSPRILDVACGSGVHLQWTTKMLPEARLRGFAGDAERARQARAAAPNAEVDSAAWTPDTPIGTGWDGVLAARILEAVASPREALETLAQALSRDGILVLEVADALQPSGGLAASLKRHGRFVFSVPTLVHAAEQLGLSDREWECCGGLVRVVLGRHRPLRWRRPPSAKTRVRAWLQTYAAAWNEAQDILSWSAPERRDDVLHALARLPAMSRRQPDIAATAGRACELAGQQAEATWWRHRSSAAGVVKRWGQADAPTMWHGLLTQLGGPFSLPGRLRVLRERLRYFGYLPGLRGKDAASGWQWGYRHKLRALRNLYAGQRCFIVGNGPSIRDLDLSPLQRELTFGSNNIIVGLQQLGFVPSFYTLIDRKAAEDNKDAIAALRGPLKLFPVTLADCIEPAADILFFNYCDARTQMAPDFSENAAEAVYMGWTVIYACLQLAFHLGFSEVYLLGVDLSYAPLTLPELRGELTIERREHFHPQYHTRAARRNPPRPQRMLTAFQSARRAFEREGRRIYNATPGGKLEIFPRVDFGAVLAQPPPAARLRPSYADLLRQRLVELEGHDDELSERLGAELKASIGKLAAEDPDAV